jgi:hypothetical protein
VKTSKSNKSAQTKLSQARTSRKSVRAKAAGRTVAKSKPKRAPVNKAARKPKQPAGPAVETVAVEVIEQPAPGTMSVTEIEETSE